MRLLAIYRGTDEGETADGSAQAAWESLTFYSLSQTPSWEYNYIALLWEDFVPMSLEELKEYFQLPFQPQVLDGYSLQEDPGCGNLYVNLDTGNCLMYGYANPVDALTTVGKYLRNIHLKDGLPPTDCYSLGKETAVGEGEVDFLRFVKKLKALGYDRFVTIEREISGQQQREDIVKAKTFFEQLWLQS